MVTIAPGILGDLASAVKVPLAVTTANISGDAGPDDPGPAITLDQVHAFLVAFGLPGGRSHRGRRGGPAGEPHDDCRLLHPGGEVGARLLQEGEQAPYRSGPCCGWGRPARDGGYERDSPPLPPKGSLNLPGDAKRPYRDLGVVPQRNCGELRNINRGRPSTTSPSPSSLLDPTGGCRQCLGDGHFPPHRCYGRLHDALGPRRSDC
ncbi:hypothetical protein STRIP9103_03436 [Streptomyces ipomoeae 91-03]|uniref:Uncharacterized protein n=1 Tax=Streptomyces ipomoeae 91-03 TaxID=698759 RepID=L1KZ77_9ACTN|nr:hypothetical protein STRIP9103_03436 [Streptomyces ipomoeae 91-03]